jgi:hypothetical protein
MTKEFTYFPEPKTRNRRPNGGRNSGILKTRKLTVSYIHINEKTVPFIRLAGDWLNRQGFNVSKKVIVREQPGQLVIQLAEEANL